MNFPKTNKIHRTFEEQVGDNAAALEELLNTFQWKLWLYRYMAVFGVFLVSLFLVIAVVRLALLIP